LIDITAADIGRQFIFVADYGAGHGLRCTKTTRMKVKTLQMELVKSILFETLSTEFSDQPNLLEFVEIIAPPDTACDAFSFGGTKKKKKKKKRTLRK
jgi:hypothetical protein